MKRVEVSRPPTITMASGLSISVPCSLSINKGSRPRIAVEAVIILGRTLPMLASLTASSKGLPSAKRDRVCVTKDETVLHGNPEQTD